MSWFKRKPLPPIFCTGCRLDLRYRYPNQNEGYVFHIRFGNLLGEPRYCEQCIVYAFETVLSNRNSVLPLERRPWREEAQAR